MSTAQMLRNGLHVNLVFQTGLSKLSTIGKPTVSQASELWTWSKPVAHNVQYAWLILHLFFAGKRPWSFPSGPGMHIFLQWNKCDFKMNTYLGMIIMSEQWIWKIRDICEMEKNTYSLRLQMNIFETRWSPILTRI